MQNELYETFRSQRARRDCHRRQWRHRAGHGPAAWPRPGRRSSSPGATPQKAHAAVAELDCRWARRPRPSRSTWPTSNRATPWYAQAVEHFGRLDILVNNAGINIRKQPEDYTLDEWNKVMAINLTGAFTCSQAAYPEMCRAGGGKIINIGSMTSIFGIPFAPAYSASKGGIVQLTKALAIAWAKDNIQVNAVLPGWIDTDLTRARPQAGAGPARARAGAHAGRALGRPGRFRRHRRVPGQCRLAIRHRHRDPGRRRIFGQRLSGKQAVGRGHNSFPRTTSFAERPNGCTAGGLVLTRRRRPRPAACARAV